MRAKQGQGYSKRRTDTARRSDAEFSLQKTPPPPQEEDRFVARVDRRLHIPSRLLCGPTELFSASNAVSDSHLGFATSRSIGLRITIEALCTPRHKRGCTIY